MKYTALIILAATAALATPAIKPAAYGLTTVKTASATIPASGHAKRAASGKSPTKKVNVRSLVLLYTASARGQIRSCNCTKFRFGGYGREQTLVKSIREKCPDVVLLEGGDSTSGTTPQAGLKADVTATALKMMDYGAMVPGEEELGVGGTSFMSHFSANSVPVICANLNRRDAGQPAFKPYVVLTTKNGLRVGVIGIIGDSINDALASSSFDTSEANMCETLKRILPVVRAKSDLVVVECHGTPEDANKLAEVNGIDLILASHMTDRKLKFPSETTNEVPADVTQKGGVTLVNAETKSNWSLGRIDITLTSKGKIADAKHTLVYLDRRYDEDPEMVKVFDDYTEKVKNEVLSTAAKFKSDTEAILVSRGLNIAEVRKRVHTSPYSTSEKCKDCHAEIYEKWSKTKHAQAMATLEKTHQDYDPECIGCHADGSNHTGWLHQPEGDPSACKCPVRSLPRCGEKYYRRAFEHLRSSGRTDLPRLPHRRTNA